MIAEGFTHGSGTALNVQLRPIANIATLSVVDVRFIQTNIGPQRTGDIDLLIDGDQYRIRFTLTEEAIDQRTVQGHEKRKNPQALEM